MEAQPVIDECTGVHGNGLRCKDPEVEEGWCNALEVRGVCEEGENFFATARNPELCLEGVCFHRFRGARDLVLGRAEREEWGGTGAVACAAARVSAAVRRG